jgi:uncharacterized LabA/DUF88 family protein
VEVCNNHQNHHILQQVIFASAFPHSSTTVRSGFIESRRRREDSCLSSIELFRGIGPNNHDWALLLSSSQSWSRNENNNADNNDGRPAPVLPPSSFSERPIAFPEFSPPPSPSIASVTPLKVMIFIDGTWLYYSLYEREYQRDAFAHRLGRTWKDDYVIDWNKLPTVACQALMQDKRSSWTAIMPPDTVGAEGTATTARPIEISRVSVYSSMHRETSESSNRYRMFSDMMSAGFDVNMMETLGKNEKCVDIQLAVDMLYYATIPDSYDVALLLTGDRDFVPAVIRCRQKGRKMGLLSMRSGATLAFTDTPNLKDFDTIWLEDYANDLVHKRKPVDYPEVRQSGEAITAPNSPRQNSTEQVISPSVLKTAVTKFITESGHPRVSSRDIGRFLKVLYFGQTCLLTEIKRCYGGLYQFLIVSEIYQVDSDSRGATGAPIFWVSMKSNIYTSNETTGEDISNETLSDDEFSFLNKVAQTPEKRMLYTSTIDDADPNWKGDKNGRRASNVKEAQKSKSDLIDECKEDLNTRTVLELKEICRKNGLGVSGKKIDLIERIQTHESHHREKKGKTEGVTPEKYFENIILEYLHANGGSANMRQVGRYLFANWATKDRQKREANPRSKVSALEELKEIYGSLAAFVKESPLFKLGEVDSNNNLSVSLRTPKESFKTLETVEKASRQQS